MESQTRFNLNAAIENWRAELATQAGLTPDMRRELETHLRDTITGFQQRGLNDEEAFWLARRRVGQPEQLVTEFAKADPAAVWRERVFWLALGILTLRLAAMFMNSFYTPLFSRGGIYTSTVKDLLPQWVAFYLPGWVNGFHYMFALQLLPGLTDFMVIVGLLMFLKRRPAGRIQSFLAAIMINRPRFFLVISLLTMLVMLISSCLWYAFGELSLQQAIGQRMIVWLIMLIPLIAIATWLLPVRKQKAAKAT